MPDPRPVRVGIVGAGGIAQGVHLPALAAESTRVELRAVVDIDPERARSVATEWNIPHHYGTVDAMLAAEELNLVVICTPPGQHVEAVRAALAAGAWVWCEKPPALSLADHDAAEVVAGPHAPYVSYVYQHRFGSAGRHARKLISEGRLGRPLVGVCHTLWYRDHAYYEVPWRGRWETEGGGPTMGHGIHQMDLMLHLLGDWHEVRAGVGRLDRDVRTEDVSMAILTMESGAMVSVVNSVLSPRQESYLRFDFTEATLEVSHLYGYDNGRWTYTPAPHVATAPGRGAASDAPSRNGRAEEAAALWPPAEDVPSSHSAQLAVLLDCMEKGERPPVSGHDGRMALELAAGLYQSAFTGRPVSRAELVPGNPFYDNMNGGRELAAFREMA